MGPDIPSDYVYFPEYAPTQPFVTDISVMYTRVFPLVFFPLYCCGPNRFLVLGMCVSRQHTDHKQKGNEKGGGNPVNILLRSTLTHNGKYILPSFSSVCSHSYRAFRWCYVFCLACTRCFFPLLSVCNYLIGCRQVLSSKPLPSNQLEKYSQIPVQSDAKYKADLDDAK